MADINKAQLFAIIVIGLSIVVLTGLAVVTQYSYVLRLNTAATEVLHTTGQENISTRMGTSGTYPFLQTATTCINGTAATATNVMTLNTHYRVDEGDNTGGYIVITPAGRVANWNQTAVNCSISYLANTNSQSAADLFITGLTIFGTFMAIVVLALVGKIIISLFKTGKD